MTNNILCVLIARGGSKGIKDKNIQTIGGIPMICHSQRKILEAQKIIPLDYILSTDCPRIREIAETYGCWAPFLRPSELQRVYARKAGNVDDTFSYQKACSSCI